MRLKISLDFILSAMACFSIKIKFCLAILLGSILFLPYSVKAEPSAVIINEILPVPKNHDWNGDGLSDTKDEWIELYNNSESELLLIGWKLREVPINKDWSLDNFKITSKSFLVISKKDLGFGLNNDGDTVALVNPSLEIVSEVVYPDNMEDNYSFNFSDQGWQKSQEPTPGQVNKISLPQEETTQNSTPTQASKSTSKSSASSASSSTSSTSKKTEDKPTAKTEEANVAEVATSEVAGAQTNNNQNIYLEQKKNTNKIYGWILIIAGGAFIILFGAFQWKKEQVLEFIQKIQNRPKN